MPGDGGHNFDTCRIGRHAEVHLAEITRFVVIGAIKLPSAEGVRAVYCSCATSPVTEEESDGQIAFVGACILESTVFAVV